MLKKISNAICPGITVDLGTANTLIYERGKGIVVNEPSVVAFKPDGQHFEVLAVGASAKEMRGRTPLGVGVVSPIKGGVVANFRMTEVMLKHFIDSIPGRRPLGKRRTIICVPPCITAVERRAVYEAADVAGAGEVFLLEEAMAGAIGAGLPVMEPCGTMIVDVGGGTTDVAVISLGGIVYTESTRMAGQALDERIIDYVRATHHLCIGEQTAERVKMSIGTARPTKSNANKVTVKGRDVRDGLPKCLELSENEIYEAIKDPIEEIMNLIKRVLEFTPPELSADISERGITLTGGGSLLRELDARLSDETGIPVGIAQDPLSSVATGSGKILEQFPAYKSLLKSSASESASYG